MYCKWRFQTENRKKETIFALFRKENPPYTCIAVNRVSIPSYILCDTTASSYAQQVQAKPEVDYLIQTELILSRKCGIYQSKENTIL